MDEIEIKIDANPDENEPTEKIDENVAVINAVENLAENANGTAEIAIDIAQNAAEKTDETLTQIEEIKSWQNQQEQLMTQLATTQLATAEKLDKLTELMQSIPSHLSNAVEVAPVETMQNPTDQEKPAETNEKQQNPDKQPKKSNWI